MKIVFDNPNFLWFLLGIPLMILAHFYNWKFKKKQALMFSNFEAISRVFEPPKVPPYPLQIGFRILIFIVLVFAAAGINLWYIGPSTDINFAIAIDTSSSMSSQDISPSRLGVAKETAIAFVDSLPINAKVATISFAGTSFVESTLTDNKNQVKESIAKMKLKPTGGTDLGEAIVSSANLLLDDKENKSKSIILITDGQSTVGLPLRDAIKYVQDHFITVNTIGIGTKEGGDILGKDELKVTQLDETTLKEIAQYTGGRYYEATAKEDFQNAYEEISQAVYQNIKIELTPYFISIVILLLIGSWLLTLTKYSNLP